MDEYFGDIYTLICDRELEIIQLLREQIVRYDEVIVCPCRLVGELDALLAMADVASRYRLVRLKVVAENIIDIKQGR